MWPAIVGERAGIPSVAVAATSFLPLVRALTKAEGLPDQRYAEYPGAFAVNSETEMQEKIGKMTFGQIVEGLTKAVKSAGEDSAESRSIQKVTGTVEEINEVFEKNKWTDGLPIIPPTNVRVEEFLKYTDRSPQEEIAVLPPGNLRATPRNIAINGVMAGCRPEHMPLLIAVVEAMADPYYNLSQIGTTGGVNAFLLMNGPVVKQLGFKHDIGFVNCGPNPVLGRFMGLAMRNLASLRAAEQLAGTFGYVMPFALAENEDSSPWNPFHVEHGFDRNTSTVTVGGTFNWGFQAFPSGENAEDMFKIICDEILKNVSVMASVVFREHQMTTVLITPNVAQVIARAGYSKRDIQKYFFDNCKWTIEQINFALKYGNPTGTATTIRGAKKDGWDISEEWVNLQPNDTVPIMPDPNHFHIVVCGDITRNKVMTFHTDYLRPPKPKEVKLPAKWDELMQKLGYPALQTFLR